MPKKKMPMMKGKMTAAYAKKYGGKGGMAKMKRMKMKKGKK